MIIFPAIDLIGGQAVRLLRGDYRQMTVYDPDPVSVANRFRALGAEAVHLVDLEGARDGGLPNKETILRIKQESGLFCEIGGGIRDMACAEAYLENGIDRVILGTAAVTDPGFAEKLAAKYPGRVAAGADLRDGFIAVRGWLEQSSLTVEAFIERMLGIGIDTLIITDISKDGAMQGTASGLYRSLAEKYPIRITASGGVSSLEDVRSLRKMDLYGAIIGKAYYTGAISLPEAIEAAK